VAAEEQAAVAIGDGEWLAGAAITGLAVACAVGAPHLVRGINVAGGCARRPNGAALALLRHQAVAVEDVTDGGAGRQGPAGVALTADRQELLGTPGGMPWWGFKDRRHDMVRRGAG